MTAQSEPTRSLANIIFLCCLLIFVVKHMMGVCFYHCSPVLVFLESEKNWTFELINI
jgi:hypothetical protein